jgi:cysteine synthase A
MAYYMIENEGIFMGGSSALNLAAVVKYARDHPNSKIVTIVHDYGNRYLKKFYST